MKKHNLRRLFVVAVLALIANVTMAQTYTYPVRGEQGFSVSQKTRDGMRINYELGSFTLNQLNYRGEEMSEISIKGIVLPNTEGCPNIPTESRLMAIPQGSTATLNVVRAERQVIKNVNIAPALRIQNENEEPDMEYKKDMKVYSRDAFYPENPFEVSKSYIRGVDAVTVSITPFQYNPVTKELVVYTDVELSLSYEGGNGQFGEDRLRSPYWDPILAAELMNYDQLPVIDYEARMQQWLRDGAEGAEYIIITPNNDAWAPYAQQLKEFRMKQGIITEVYRIDEMPATTTAQMKTWFHNAYDNWEIAPVAVCLFGDHNTNMSQGIPAETTSHPYSGSCITDNFYADAAGNDNLPDMVFSRLVAQNESELPIFTSKQIDYESAPNMDAAFYQSPITALGWQTERWFQLCSEVFGGYMRSHDYTPQRINCIYDGTPGNTWSSAQNTSQVVNYFGPNGQNYIPATPSEMGGWTGGSPQQVVDAVNAGTFWVQHRDHGLDEGWGEPAVRNNHVDQMNNVGKLPFLMSINCQTGMFNYTGSNGNCFTEKWMRRTYNGENAGAVGVLSPTEVSYSFVNDAFVWGVYDLFDGDFMPTYGPFQPAAPMTGNWMPAFGNVAGKYFLAQSSWPYNEDSKDITYTMFTAHCDAFLRIYTQVPQTMTVNHQSVQLAGLTTFQITAPEGAAIALTKGEGENLEVVAVAQATGSAQNIEIPAQVPPTVLRLTVTGQNYLRYEANIEVIPASGPYIIINEYALSNAAPQLNFGDEAGLDIQLKNVGNSQASSGTATLTTDSEYVTITDGTVDFTAISSNATTDINNAFSFTVSDEVPNRTNIEFVITINSGSETYENHITLKAYAPVFEIGNVSIVEIEGNGNGRLDPGETAELHFPVTNKGNADSWATDATLVMNNPFLQFISEPTITLNSIAAGNTTDEIFYEVYVGAAPSGFAADYTLNVVSGVYTDTKDFVSKIGLNVEDFELGTLNPELWTNDATNPWTFTTEAPYEGQYCMKSGTIGHSQETSLILNYELGEADSIAFYYKVSSEGSWDKMYFYIDNQEKANWSGTVAWTRAQYAVTAGTHTFKWKYAKDSSVSSGSDCCWIDFVILPADRSLSVSAGVDMELCEGETAQLAGFAANQSSVEWTTVGDGTFDNASILDAVYTPGAQDIANGGATLTLTATQGTQTMSDEMTVSFKSAPTIEIPETLLPIVACMGVIDITDYYIVENADEIMLTTSGDGAFNGNVYTFGEQDINNGNVTLTITAYGCGEATGSLAIGYEGVPVVSGTETVSTCTIDPISIEVTFETTWGFFGEWTTDGTGSFADQFAMTTTYTPSEEDFNNGNVVLTAMYSDCQANQYYHNVTITFTSEPTATGSDDIEICQIQPVEVYVIIENYNDFLGWTTTGTGTFNNPNEFNTSYTPTTADFAVGNVTLSAVYTACNDTQYSYDVNITLNGVGTLPQPSGPTNVYNSEAVTEYTVVENETFIGFTWILEPANAGTMVQNNNTVTITWNMECPDTEVRLSVIGHTSDCGDSEPSEPLTISLRGYGVDEVSTTEINVHPNPTNDIVNVSIENLTADVQIVLYNSVGQAVYTKNESADNGLNTVINLGDFANGTYLLQIRSEEGIWMKRVIKR